MSTVTTTDVEAVLGRSLTTDESSRVARLIQMAEGRLESRLPGFSLATGTATDEVIPYDDPDVMWTAHYPVTSVTSLKLDGNTVDTPGYRWTEKGQITIWGGGRLNEFEINLTSFSPTIVTVSYGYGTNPAPAEVVAAVAEDVVNLLSPGGNVRQETIGSYSVSYSDPIAESDSYLPPSLRRWCRTRQLSAPFVRYR